MATDETDARLYMQVPAVLKAYGLSGPDYHRVITGQRIPAVPTAALTIRRSP